jgi:G3E family GTPase
MIDEVRTAEERLDADQRALERKTEMFENAWRADRMALNQERQTLAVQRQEQERKSIDLARWASALAEGRLNLHNEQAIFRQQRAEAEQEQEKKTIGLARWESALAKARLDLHNEQAIFRQQRVEAEQEQYHPRLLRTRELIWAASEEELLSILNTVRYRLATRGSSTNAPEQITRPPRLP